MNENILSYKNGAIQFFIFTFLSFNPFFTHFSTTQIYTYTYIFFKPPRYSPFFFFKIDELKRKF